VIIFTGLVPVAQVQTPGCGGHRRRRHKTKLVGPMVCRNERRRLFWPCPAVPSHQAA